MLGHRAQVIESAAFEVVSESAPELRRKFASTMTV